MAGLERVARRERRGRFVTIFNDLGERYFSTRLWDRRADHAEHPARPVGERGLLTTRRSPCTGRAEPG